MSNETPPMKAPAPHTPTPRELGHELQRIAKALCWGRVVEFPVSEQQHFHEILTRAAQILNAHAELVAALQAVALLRTCGERGRWLDGRSDTEVALDSAIMTARAALAKARQEDGK